MSADLRSFLNQVQESLPELFWAYTKEVDPRYGVTAVLQRLEDEGQFPIVLFENVRNLAGEPGHRVLSNLFADLRLCRLAIGLSADHPLEGLSQTLAERIKNAIPPRIVPRAEAPVKEVVWVGEEVDLTRLPVVTHHEGDGGPYLTQGVISCDPDTGVYNFSFHRMMIRGPSETGILLTPQDTFDNYIKYEAQGKSCPIVAVLGHHPALFLTAAIRMPKTKSELDAAGGLLGAPLLMTASETWGEDFPVPADAEIVVEGEILPHLREVEGPFGEWTGYQSGIRPQPIVRVLAITHRRDPILITNFVGHRDIFNLQGIGWEADILRRVREAVPTVRAVHLPSSGCGGFHLYISLKKRVEGDAKTAAYAAVGFGFPKLIVVVDEDIDVFNESQVLWAMATRAQAGRDMEIIRGVRGSMLDPSSESPPVHDTLIIDATRPLGVEYPTPLRVPPEEVAAVDLSHYYAQR